MESLQSKSLGSSLWDPGSGNFLSIQSRNKGVSFLNLLRSCNDPEPGKEGIRREHIEEIITLIRTALLLRIPDPLFTPINGPTDDFPDEYREALQMWDKRFSHFLKEATGSKFQLL